MALNLTNFESLLRVVKSLGADEYEVLLPDGILDGSASLNPEDVVFGETGLFYVDVSGAVARIVVHIADKDMIYINRGSKSKRSVNKSGLQDKFIIEQKLHRYHLFNCGTLETAASEGWRDKYKQSRRKDGRFHYRFLRGNRVVAEVEDQQLFLCKNCLNKLNTYDMRKKMPRVKWPDFDLDGFLNLSTSFDCINGHFQNADISKPNVYSRDFQLISRRLREKCNWQCQNNDCKHPDLSAKHLRRYLQVHHRNLDKSDDGCQNLVALCLACHAEQPNHSQIKSLPEYQQFIRKVGK